MPDIVVRFAQSFNLEQVTSSLQGFLGSGYVGIIVLALLAYSLFIKLMKLVGFACVAVLIWLFCTSDMATPVFAALGLG